MDGWQPGFTISEHCEVGVEVQTLAVNMCEVVREPFSDR